MDLQIASGVKLDYFLKARVVALENDKKSKSRHSCLVVNNHRIISSEYNQKRQRLEGKYVTSCHAEHLALVRAKGFSEKKHFQRFRPLCY